jgi:hypothetical protein
MICSSVNRFLFIVRLHLLARTLNLSGGNLQGQVNDYLTGYNTKRPHQGRGMNGRTPETVFIAGLPKPQPKQKEKAEPRKRQDHIAA